MTAKVASGGAQIIIAAPTPGRRPPRGPAHVKQRMSDDLTIGEEAGRLKHDACLKHPERDVLGMSHGPFSGANEALGIIAQLEDENDRLRKWSISRWRSDDRGCA